MIHEDRKHEDKGVKRALYLNKFGIMHSGIVELVRDIEEAPDIDEIVLGICSSQFSDRNPSPEKQGIYNCLDAQEREQVMRASLSMVQKPIRYIHLPDHMPIIKTMPENPWIDMVVEMCPEFHVMYTERDVEEICMADRGKEIRGITKHVAFSDHCIRDKIARLENWEPFFEPEAATLLKRLDIVQRYKTLYAGMDVERERAGRPIDYEYRTFGELPDETIIAFEGLEPFCEQEIEDRYILSLVRTGINMKSRRGGVKVKELLKSVDGIEQYVTEEFPYPADVHALRAFCKKTRFPMIPGLPDGFYEHNIVKGMPNFVNPYLMLVDVDKTRDMRLYTEGNIRVGVELNTVCIHKVHNSISPGEGIISIGIEGKSHEEVDTVRKALGLVKPSCNYLQFLEAELRMRHGQEIYDNMWI
jgi:nicotinamide mononucleotide adenylyltransferase